MKTSGAAIRLPVIIAVTITAATCYHAIGLSRELAMTPPTKRVSCLPFIQETLQTLWQRQSARLGGKKDGIPFITVSQSPTHAWTSVGVFDPAGGAYQLVPVPARDLEMDPRRIDFAIWPVLNALTRLTGDPEYRREAERMAAAFAQVGFDGPSGLLRLGAGMFDFDVVAAAPVATGPWAEPAYKPGNWLAWNLLWNASPEQMARFMKATYFGLVTRSDDMRFNRYVMLGFDSRERQLVQRFNPMHRGFLLTGAILIQFWSWHHLRTGDPETLDWAERMTRMWETTRHPQTGLLPHFIGAVTQDDPEQSPAPYANSKDCSAALIFLQTARDLARQPETAALAARLHDLGAGLIRGLAEHAYDPAHQRFHDWICLEGGPYTGEAFYTFRTQADKDAALKRDPKVAVVEVHAGDGFFRSARRDWTCGASLPVYIAQAAAMTGDPSLIEHGRRLAEVMLREAQTLPGAFNTDGQWTFPAKGVYIRMLLALYRATGETRWLDAADDLAQGALRDLRGLPADRRTAWLLLPERSGFLAALADLEEEYRLPSATAIVTATNGALDAAFVRDDRATDSTARDAAPTNGYGLDTQGALRLVRLDPAQALTPGAAQYAWAEETLGRPFAGWTVVLFPEPLFSVLPHRGYHEQWLDLLAPLMEQLRVDIVVCGGDEGYLRVRPFAFKSAGAPVMYLALGGSSGLAPELRPAAWIAAQSPTTRRLRFEATARRLRVHGVAADGQAIEVLQFTRDMDSAPGRPWSDLVAENRQTRPPLPVLPSELWDRMQTITFTFTPDTTVFDAVFDDPTGGRLRFNLRWTLPDGCAWDVNPREAAFAATTGGTARALFAISPPPADKFYPLPALDAEVTADGYRLRRWTAPVKGLNRPSLSVRPTTKAPLLDGALNDPGWTNAAVATLAWSSGGAGRSAHPTTVRLTYDAAALYVAFECLDDNPLQAYRKATAATSADAWKDDCVEVSIDPAGDRINARQFITTVGGITLDTAIAHREGRTRWLPFDGAWRQRVQVHKDRWIAEIAIPWTDLDLKSAPAPGARMGLNLVRLKRVPATDPGREPDFAYSQWAVTFGGNTAVDQFGVLLFD